MVEIAPPGGRMPLRRGRSGNGGTNGSPRNILRGPGGGAGNRKRSRVTLWIGMSMFCLVFVYAAVVLLVTRLHWPDKKNRNTSADASMNSIPTKDEFADSNQPPKQQQQQQQVADDTTRDSSTTEGRRQKFKDKIQEAKEVKRKTEEENNKPNQDTRRRNTIKDEKEKRKATFGAGVDPMKLAHHKAEEAPIAFKEDPPASQHVTPHNILTAYLEPLQYEDWKVQPLPMRTTATADQLTAVKYSRLDSCSKLIQQWPVDDTPTDQDPFLPWIHDVFPSADGKYIQFVAQNKRRCKTGSKEKDILAHMAPQAALFQHISVQRTTSDKEKGTRYRLSSYADADPDGVATRHICRFKPSMQETLSEFNFDYDWTAYRKRYKVTFAEDEGGIKHIHTSQLLFRCPVPENLQETVRKGTSVHNDWATLFVDLVPIRTAPRWGAPNQYLQPKYAEFTEQQPRKAFDPIATWGTEHILPTIEDSGRWENIPICKPSSMTYENDPEPAPIVEPGQPKPKKKHRLASCLWASAGYTTRGNRFAVNDGQRRLLEWITYNKLIGFDHFFVYDNSGAFGSESSLKPIADLFPDDVTYVPWPSQICNNNPNNVDSVGERSSQYAAESSCRLRFGHNVDWIGQFDIDEYLVPMGNHTDVLSLLDELEQEDTRIISFGSWRAWPRWAFIEEPEPVHDKDLCWTNEPCFQLKIPMKHTMLQAYNCDRQMPGKKSSTMPAEKQLYKSEYVLLHFVHYSTVTVLSEMNRTEYQKEGFSWRHRAFPDARQRFGNEITEGLMIHTKAVAMQDTAGWERVCHIDVFQEPKRRRGLCRLGVPWPEGAEEAGLNATKEGWAFNCYPNPKVDDYLVPRLKANLEKHAHFFDTN